MPMARCDLCGRSFSRNEHLIRHLRSHSGERPFACPHCKAGFHRADVRDKHIKKVHPEHRPPPEASGTLPPDRQERVRPRERSRLACDQCRKRKLKCDSARPCGSCVSKNLSCTVSSTSRPPGRPRNPSRVPADNRRAHRDDEDDLQVSPTQQLWTPNSLDSALEPPSLMSSMTGVSMSGMGGSSGSYSAASAYAVPVSQPCMASEPASNFTIQTPFSSGVIPEEQLHGGMDFMDNLFPLLDTGSWLDDLNEFALPDYSWPTDSVTPVADPDSAMKDAVDMMKDHLQRRSRASSPSRDEQKRSWYSSPPRLSVYSQDVLNILLNLARTHISSTFSIFSDFQADSDTAVELCLAMCSVGGLYCTAYAGVKFAKMLFNDARRLLLERYLLNKDTPSFDASLSFAKTFVLLEIYGLCSGDKRAYEFIEVFHGSKLDVVICCLRALPKDASAASRQQVQLLMEATRVLDSYRVLLLRRPPSFTEDVFSESGIQRSCSPPLLGVNSTPRSEGPLGAPATDIDRLAAAISYTWMTSPQNNENSGPALWKQDFVELALGRWIQAKAERPDAPGPLDAPQMLLYHLAKVSIHSNLSHLQRLTPAALKSAVAPQNEDAPDPVREWMNSRHFEISQWHAQAILRIAQEVMAPPGRFIRPGTDKRQAVEAPHMPLCIYFATLVVWCGEMASWDGRRGALRASVLDTGSQLLFRLRVPVSKLLGTVLRELMSNDGS